MLWVAEDANKDNKSYPFVHNTNTRELSTGHNNYGFTIWYQQNRSMSSSSEWKYSEICSKKYIYNWTADVESIDKKEKQF